MPSERGLLAQVRSARRRLAHSGPEQQRAVGDFERVSLPTADCDALRDLLIEEQAHVVIEIGLAYGSSALAIAEAVVRQGQFDAQHLIIDAYQDDFRNVGREGIVAAGLGDICRLITDRSQLVLPSLVRERFVADGAFVDGSHIFHNVFVDLYFLQELVRPGRLVIMDDCEWPSVATAVRYFELNAGWRREAIHQPTRLRAYRLPDPHIEPRFEDFKPFGDEPAT